MTSASVHLYLDALLGRAGTAAQYLAAHRTFSLFPLLGPVTHFINAPFGRFSLASSRLNVNGNLGWFLMEIVSPVAFGLALLSPALDTSPVATIVNAQKRHTALAKLASLSTPTKILASLFMVHYANRSTISSLRTPAPRSRMHIVVPIAAVAFNVLNGYLMGSWLGGRTSPLTAAHGAVPEFALHTGLFWLGVLTWFAGFVGNLVSDEILYNLRRPSKDGKPKPRYSVPRGFLYDVPFGGISFPAYLCEWAEWLGYAVAACCYSIAPALPLSPMSTSGTEALEQATQIFASDPARATCQLFRLSTYATPPFLFFYAEVATMLFRALKGHKWYQRQFKQDFPAQRKAIIPGVL